MKKNRKEFLLLTVSAVIIAIGIHFFKFPNNFTFGGVTGIAVLAAKTGYVSASSFTLIINILLLCAGFIFTGKSFGLRTVYVSILLSLLLILFDRLFPLSSPLTNEPVLELVFAIVLPAVGSAILFNYNASSGGTDIVAMLLKKYTNIDIGKALFLTDLIIATAACFVFDIKTGLFSFTGLTIKSLIIDSVIENINLCKFFNVICNNPEPICNFIVKELHRSATVCEAKGAYLHTDKHIIYTVLNCHEAIMLKLFLKKTEPDFFILIFKTSEIIGRGFHSI